MRNLTKILAALSGLTVLALAAPGWATPPCDQQANSWTYYPSSSSHGVLLYEDSWPATGDKDFNDTVLTYQYTFGQNAAGLVSSVTVTFNVLAAGNGRPNGFALHLPVPKGEAGAMTLEVGNGAPASVSARTTSDTDLIVDVLTDTKAAFNDVGSGLVVNTDPTLATMQTQPYRLYVPFSTPVSQATLSLASAPFDLFSYWTADPTHEIHRPMYAGTSLMNQSLFGTASDGSTSGRHYVDNLGIPYFLDVGQTQSWAQVWPTERTAVDVAFPQIVGFAQSGGTTNTSFFTAPVAGKTFVQGAAGSLPPAPTFIDGSGALVTSCDTCSDGIQNEGETGVDCGGPCGSCASGPPQCIPDASMSDSNCCASCSFGADGVGVCTSCSNACCFDATGAFCTSLC